MKNVYMDSKSYLRNHDEKFHGYAKYKGGTSDCDPRLSVCHGLGKRTTSLSLFSFSTKQLGLFFDICLIFTCQFFWHSVFVFWIKKCKESYIYFFMESWPAKLLGWINETKLTGNLLILTNVSWKVCVIKNIKGHNAQGR